MLQHLILPQSAQTRAQARPLAGLLHAGGESHARRLKPASGAGKPAEARLPIGAIAGLSVRLNALFLPDGGFNPRLRRLQQLLHYPSLLGRHQVDDTKA